MTPLIQELSDLLGPGGVLVDADVAARRESWASDKSCEALAVARPSTTEQVSAILALCHANGVPVVPYGGGTGLVQGAIAGPGELLLTLERMRRIVEVNEVERIAIVEAGAPLQAVQQAADAANLFFPLDLGARGSATIGGNIATNAGGNRVIRFGMIREMVLGVEAVLADGTTVSSMNRMLKNNTGYDLRQIFIGSEGTLGVITRAVLRLREKCRSECLALVAVRRFADVLRLLKTVDAQLGGMLSAFEVMWREFYEAVTLPRGTNAPPLPQGEPFYVLIESLGGDPEQDAQRFEQILAELIETGAVADAAVATSQAQRNAMWTIRDSVEQLFDLGPMLMFDVSLPISAMEAYVSEVRARLASGWKDHDCVVWGHLGDSNLHLWITVQSMSPEARSQVERIVYEPLRRVGGSISAEHGIGVEKREHLGISRTADEIALMYSLKQAFDPAGLLNPGKVLI
jgi:FAD/FMN-containing dehydrogenase